MFKSFRFKQKGGKESTNIQAVNYTTGISYEDAKGIALDVFKNNFYELSTSAAEVASARAEEITEKYLQELKKKKPEAISNVNDPDIQYALFNAQMQYARNNDADLGGILIDLLVERSEEKQRDFKQIVLNESIEVLSKLNKEQINILTLVFCLRCIRLPQITSLPTLKYNLKNLFEPLFIEQDLNINHFLHLEYCGCLNVERLGSSNLNTILSDTYKGLFCNGFTFEHFEERFKHLANNVLPELLIPNLHDNNKFQFNAMGNADISSERLGIPIQDVQNLIKFFDEHKMDEPQVIKSLTNLYPGYTKMLELWERSDLKSSQITPVGMAIAYTNLQRKIEVSSDLSNWLK
ncbi:LPO_1073/Vpar_1526 family protein [Bacillus hominis]|uniref:LPO_1073/Vpar_1526 family protein n=1 Tax=Bacillus hominis TaxID=2817478 RepID=UPI003D658F33